MSYKARVITHKTRDGACIVCGETEEYMDEYGWLYEPAQPGDIDQYGKPIH